MFQYRNFRQAALESFCTAESRGEKCLNQFPGERMTDHEAAKAH